MSSEELQQQLQKLPIDNVRNHLKDITLYQQHRDATQYNSIIKILQTIASNDY